MESGGLVTLWLRSGHGALAYYKRDELSTSDVRPSYCSGIICTSM